MRRKGTLVEWNDSRGFGFIEPAGGGERAFCHISAFAVRVRRPLRGERVTYEVSKDERGRLRATQIRPVSGKLLAEDRKTKTPRAPSPLRAYLGVGFFSAIVIALTLMRRVPWFLPMTFLILSAVTIFAYAFDKSAAMNRRWRTRESTLQLLALLGGWPGAWIAQALFHHKSRKTEFRVVFWLCVFTNIGALAWIAYGDEIQLRALLQ
jgi:uncharacterized membrane protein YsdA (DUF1294 family)/cold shock CspA family protein